MLKLCEGLKEGVKENMITIFKLLLCEELCTFGLSQYFGLFTCCTKRNYACKNIRNLKYQNINKILITFNVPFSNLTQCTGNLNCIEKCYNKI